MFTPHKLRRGGDLPKKRSKIDLTEDFAYSGDFHRKDYFPGFIKTLNIKENINLVLESLFHFPYEIQSNMLPYTPVLTYISYYVNYLTDGAVADLASRPNIIRYLSSIAKEYNWGWIIHDYNIKEDTKRFLDKLGENFGWPSNFNEYLITDETFVDRLMRIYFLIILNGSPSPKEFEDKWASSKDSIIIFDDNGRPDFKGLALLFIDAVIMNISNKYHASREDVLEQLFQVDTSFELCDKIWPYVLPSKFIGDCLVMISELLLKSMTIRRPDYILDMKWAIMDWFAFFIYRFFMEFRLNLQKGIH